MIRTPRKIVSNRRYLSEGDCCSRGFPPVAAGVRGRAGLESKGGGRTRSSGSSGPAALAAPGSPGVVASQAGRLVVTIELYLAVGRVAGRCGRRAVAAPFGVQARRRGLPGRLFCPICTVCCRRCRSTSVRARSRIPVSVPLVMVAVPRGRRCHRWSRSRYTTVLLCAACALNLRDCGPNLLCCGLQPQRQVPVTPGPLLCMACFRAQLMCLLMLRLLGCFARMCFGYPSCRL